MNKHEIEYEDAPSGFVTFYNYKEPLMKYTDGYGFMGALIFDGDTDKIQCHLCGHWLGSLSHHLHREHNMSANDYKEKVGLFKTTALISESARAKLIASGLDKRLQNLRAGGKHTKASKEKIRATLKKNGQKSENMNLRGTCPEQLIDRLKKLYAKLGNKMNERSDESLYMLLRRTYGSNKEAFRIAGIPYRKPGTNLNYDHVQKYNEEDLVKFIQEFIVQFHRSPTYRDFQSQGKIALYKAIINRRHKDYKTLVTQAYVSLDEYKKPDIRINYTKTELLEMLRKFAKINGRKPSVSDGKRCLIPYPSRYIYHFGSWHEALKLAFTT